MKQAFGIALFLGFLLLTPFAEASSPEPSARIAAGAYYTCALTSAGKVWCWGYNSSGELGNGTAEDSSTPVSVRGLSDAVAIAAGDYHTCALTSAGKVLCWGVNDDGQLGNATSSGPEVCDNYPCSTTPVSVKGLSDAVAIAAGSYHTCALTSDGKVWCWGANYDGQLGNETEEIISTTPVSVRGLSDAVAMAAGEDYTCALTSAGKVWCWGVNDDGQLGNGTRDGPETCISWDGNQVACSTTPVSVQGLSDAIAIAAGEDYTCALTSAGKVWCWGDNDFGQLGNGTKKKSSTPVSVRGLSDAVAIAAGSYHTCALTSAGNLSAVTDTARAGVFCWGENEYGQLGIGTDDGPETCIDWVGDQVGCSTTPVSVQGPSDAVTIAAGGYHTCALTSEGKVLCWGWNYFGQLGIGTDDGPETCDNDSCSTTPVAVKFEPR